MKRYAGVSVIVKFNAVGKLIGVFAFPKFEELFSIPLFLLIVLPGMVLLGHYG